MTENTEVITSYNSLNLVIEVLEEFCEYSKNFMNIEEYIHILHVLKEKRDNYFNNLR